ncbi:cupin domain-containing protein [Terriglobus saanensis]|uniref:Cupin 2 conserved barrel domain protein n=1 Tax=Terriglobus saanensis (strain ATCC BAA-1853 / DSM 23119 / SP1PR4) TaxID=401053 RepID=E8V3E2_TERSS|nr:hypothetical protein [Terriglobus saanensis]ADV82499.1 hypothetical protein AciPR4_1692 [Terriglobus saanensis SP1PR4]
MTKFFARLALVASVSAGSLAAQTALPPVTNDTVDRRTSAEIEKQAAELLKIAKEKPDGMGGVTLERYPGHLTMLTVRTKSGGGEMHKHFNDFFIVISGEANVLTGGTIPDAKEGANGEVRGSSVVGGVDHLIRKGDVLHISPGINHQTTVKPGTVFTYYVIKVEEPKS